MKNVVIQTEKQNIPPVDVISNVDTAVKTWRFMNSKATCVVAIPNWNSQFIEQKRQQTSFPRSIKFNNELA